jgi:hypothetical protein
VGVFLDNRCEKLLFMPVMTVKIEMNITKNCLIFFCFLIYPQLVLIQAGFFYGYHSYGYINFHQPRSKRVRSHLGSNSKVQRKSILNASALCQFDGEII